MIKNILLFFISIILSSTFLTSCFLNRATQSTSTRSSAKVANSQDSVSPGYGRLLLANPIALTGDRNLSPSVDIASYLEPTPIFISDTHQLLGNCSTDLIGANVFPCFSARKDEAQSSPLYSSSNRWAYPVTTSEFLQVNVYGHLKKIIHSFIQDLKDAQTELPYTVNPLTSNKYWLLDTSLTPIELKGYADAHPSDAALNNNQEWANSRYVPSTNSLYFGKYSLQNSMIYMADDPSIIYHETGHALQHIMLNLDNLQTATTNNANILLNLGSLSYTEAGSIGEGVSDYFSYYQTRRTHFSEWAAGLLGASRPISENDYLHAAGISEDPSSRLSYPSYINYDANTPTASRVDGIHETGMIISHFLTALTKQMQTDCHVDQNSAVSTVMKTLIKTYSALGSFNSTIPYSTRVAAEDMRRVNLNINFRRFAKIFSDNYSQIIAANSKNCPAIITPFDYESTILNHYEKLLDSYGLLLFSNYTIKDLVSGVTTKPKTVNIANILKSLTISKSSLINDPTVGATPFYIIDNRSSIIDAFTKLNSIIKEDISTRINALNLTSNELFPYNNGNSKPSPGELVAVGLNLYNNSNSTMAGVHILANDWDHVAKLGTNFLYCSNFQDLWPGINQGGTSDPTCNTYTQNNEIYNPSTIPAPTDFVFPVCSVLVNGVNGSSWVSQDKYMNQLGKNLTDCLNPNDVHECFVRFPRGLDHSFISSISPKKSWTNSNLDSNGQPILSYHNLLFMEINTNVPVGTKFSCRLRASFTNCSDCFEDANKVEYSNAMYSGDKPFQIFNFEFTVSN